MSDSETLNELYITVAGEGSFRIVPSKPSIVVEEKPGCFKLSNLTKAAFPIKIVKDSGMPFNWATNPKQFIDVDKPAPGTTGGSSSSCPPLLGVRDHKITRSVNANGTVTFSATGASTITSHVLGNFTAAAGDKVTFAVTATGHAPDSDLKIAIAECVGGKWDYTWGRGSSGSSSVSFTAQTSGSMVLRIFPITEGDGGAVTFTVKGTTTKAGT